MLTGVLLSKIGSLLGRPVSQEKLSRIECNFKAELADNHAIKPDLTVLDVTEGGVTLKSSAHIEEGTLIRVYIDEIQNLLGLDSDAFILRINRCERAMWGKLKLQTTFVGFGEDKLTKIRALAIRGGYFTTSEGKSTLSRVK